MKSLAPGFQCEQFVFSWSNRILILAVGGVLFLTLYPFRFSLHTVPPLNRSPFLLVSGGKSNGPFNAFLNILLFVPLGFALAQKLRERGKSGGTILLVAMVSGAFFSYCIEFMQIYIPTRDSGWEDVFTNATGAVVGYFVFELVGKSILNSVSKIENRFERFFTTQRALSIVPAYFVAWFVLSVPLQAKSQLSNWIRDSRLVIGNDATGHLDRAWKGNLSLVQLWSQALPAKLALGITAGQLKEEAAPSPLAAYSFSGDRSFEDQKGFLSELTWTPSAPDLDNSTVLSLNGKSWLTSQKDVPNLVRTVQEAKSFSLRVVCAPKEVEGSDGRIISISKADGFSNLSLMQRDGNLVFRFRNPLTVRRDQLLFLNIPDVFTLNQPRDILVAYDGSTLSVYVDGKRDTRMFELTPGATLAQLVRHTKTNELEGYTYIYYALVFVPGGILLGFILRRMTVPGVRETVFLATAFILPCILLEIILVRVSGRAFSFRNVFLSFLFVIAGLLWINADLKRSPLLLGTDPYPK